MGMEMSWAMGAICVLAVIVLLLVGAAASNICSFADAATFGRLVSATIPVAGLRAAAIRAGLPDLDCVENAVGLCPRGRGGLLLDRCAGRPCAAD